MTAVTAVGLRPDRVREAASARHRELVAARRRLAAGHHADLRVALGLARLSCTAGLAADLEDLGRRASERVQGFGPAERVHLRSWLDGELDRVRLRSEERLVATAGPAVRRVAARLCPGAGPMALPGPPVSAAAAPGCPVPGRTVADRARAGAGRRPARNRAGASRAGGRGEPAVDPRLLVGLAGIPVLGAGGLGWSAALTALGVLVLLGALAHTRARAAARAHLRADMSRTVVSAGTGLERTVQRRLIEIERDAGAALDRAVAERRARVDLELAAVPGARR